MKLKLMMSMKILAAIKKWFVLVIILVIISKSKYYDDSNKSVISKIKDETGGVAIKEFIGLKPKMYLFLVENSEHKKGKGVNRYVVAIISHIDVFLNNKCLRQSINRIQSQDHKIGKYENINSI